MKDLTQSNNLYKTFLVFALPIMLSGLLSQSYNIIDTAIIGKWLGDNGLASVGGTASYITLISSILWGFSAGSSVFIGILFGRKSFARLKSVLVMSTLLLITLSLVITIASLVFKNQLFDFMKIDKAVREDAFRYYLIYMLGLAFVVLSNFGVTVMNAIGASGYPLKMSVLSALLNIGGNLLSVAVLHAGVTGVALATVISAAAVDICYLFKLKSELSKMGVANERVVFSREDLKTVIEYSIPSSSQQLILYGASFLVSPYINAFGKAVTAGYAVISRVLTLATTLYQNSSKTVTSFSSQCIGAKKYTLLRKGVRVGFVQALVFLLPIIIVTSVFSPQICSLFFEKGFDGKAMEVAASFVRYWMPLVTVNLINSLFHAFWRGIAKMRYLIGGTLVGSGTQVIATVLLSPVGLWGIWLAWSLSWLVEAIFNVLLYKASKWDKDLA